MSTPAVPPETLDFLFGHVHDAPDKQLLTQEALDGKIVQVFAAAGVVLGLAGTQDVHGRWEAGLLIAALCSFVVVAVAAGWSLWSRKFRVAWQPQALWERHWSKTPAELKHMLVADAVEAYSENRPLLRQKSCALRVALSAAAVEIALIGMLFVWVSVTASAHRASAHRALGTPARVSPAGAAGAGVVADPATLEAVLLHSQTDTNRHDQ